MIRTQLKTTPILFLLAAAVLLPTVALAGTEKSFDAKGISSVKVQSIEDVSIEAWTTSKVKIVCERGNINSSDVSVTATAGAVQVTDMESVCGKISVFMPKELKLRLNVISGTVSIKSAGAGAKITAISGDVVLEDVSGSVSLDLVSGHADVRKAKGELNIKTVSGNVSVKQFEGERVSAKSVSGDVSFESVQVSIATLKSHSGLLAFKSSPLPKTELVAKTFSGDVEVTIDESEGFDITAKTFSGDVSVAHKITTSTLEDNKLVGQHKNGGPEVTLGSHSGDIQIKK